MVISKKYFEITAHAEAKWPSQQNILNSPYFSSICGHNFDRTDDRKSLVSSRMWLAKQVIRPEFKILLVK